MKRSLTILNQQDSKLLGTPAELTSERFRGRAAVVTLGCAKNQVDSEVMLGVLLEAGYEIVRDIDEADVAIINTCGFLESAVKEGIDCIIEVAELKQSGRLRKLLVAGCMVERYRGDLASEFPEVDAFLTTDQLLDVAKAAEAGVDKLFEKAARPYFLYDDSIPRFLSTQSHTAYVKVSEGCNRPCAFCIIPQIRGSIRSRDLESVVREVDSLQRRGVREVNLVAQDLTAYGADIGKVNLPQLLRALNDRTEIEWIRLLYAYPLGINLELLNAIRELPAVCEYLDFPLQHASERVLKAMRRPLGKYSPRKMVEFIRENAPEIHLRTTFIVGFPGETERDIEELEALIRDGDFTSVGIFEYSAEAGTPAAEMGQQVPAELSSERRERLMLVQQSVVMERLKRYIGERVETLVEGLHEESDLLLAGRTRFQAPEVDGLVMINDFSGGNHEDIDISALSGRIGTVEISEVVGYDLVGSLELA